MVEEFRDPKGGTLGYEWMSPGRPVRPRWDGDRAMRDGYNASWLVNRAINVIANTISALPFRAGANPDDRNDYNQNATLARLLGPPPGNPNLEWSAREMWRSAIVNYLVTGRFAWEITPEGAAETGWELWPLITAQLNPVVQTGRRSYFSGFEYTPNGEIGKVQFGRDEVVYGYRKSADNPREPESALISLALNVDVMVEVDRYTWAFMANDAKPATMVIHAPIASPEAKEAFYRQWASDFKGPMNANKTGFVEAAGEDGTVTGAIQIEQVGSSNKDSQITQIYEQHKQAVSSGLGVPMSLLDASGRTFDNASEEAKNYYELTVMPLAQELSDIINRELAPKVGPEVGWFDVSNVAALKPRITAGVNFADVKDNLLVDEQRQFVGLGPVDKQELQDEKAAAIDLAQQSMFPTADPQVPADQQAPAQKDPAPAPAETTDNTPPTRPSARPRTRAEIVDDAIDRVREPAVLHLARVFESQFSHATQRSEHACLTRAEGKRGKQMLERGDDASAIYDQSFWQAETRSALVPFYLAAASAAAATLAEHVDVYVDTTRWAEERAEALATTITTLRANWLGDAVKPGVTQELLVEAIRDVHSDRTLPHVRMEAERAFDDAVRVMSGVPRDDVRTLLSRLAAGTINLDKAMEELIP